MLWLPAAAEAAFAVTSAAFARFFGGNANSMRCLTTMPSDAKARSLAEIFDGSHKLARRARSIIATLLQSSPPLNDELRLFWVPEHAIANQPVGL